jgi:hypothetical protein
MLCHAIDKQLGNWLQRNDVEVVVVHATILLQVTREKILETEQVDLQVTLYTCMVRGSNFGETSAILTEICLRFLISS